MRNFLIGFVSLCLFTAAGCGKGTPYYKDAQSQATPEPTVTPKPYEGKAFMGPVEAELTKVPGTVKLSGDGYIKGKTARFYQSIDRESKDKKDKPSWTYDTNLDAVQRAFTPSDVETVVLQKCVEVQMGMFQQDIGIAKIGEKVPAFGWKCDVTVIDKTIPAVVGRKSFATEIKESETVREGAKEIKRSPPLVEINNYLKGLPKK